MTIQYYRLWVRTFYKPHSQAWIIRNNRFYTDQDRVMFGSDFPNIPYDYSVGIQSIMDLPVNDRVKEKIFVKNALTFYSME